MAPTRGHRLRVVSRRVHVKGAPARQPGVVDGDSTIFTGNNPRVRADMTLDTNGPQCLLCIYYKALTKKDTTYVKCLLITYCVVLYNHAKRS